MKYCEKCKTQIPDDFQNDLCIAHYVEQERASTIPVSSGVTRVDPLLVLPPEYKENPQVEDIDMVSRAHGRFKGSGFVMPERQFKLYHKLKDWLREAIVMHNAQYPKFIWKPKVCDVGSGLGIGTNIISQEASYTLGLDKNAENVNWATQMFERTRNNVYYTSEVSFRVCDVETEDREFMKFDVVTCIEVFEHLDKYERLLKFLVKLGGPETVFFISTPNRNAPEIQKDTPKNPHHVRELTAQEFIKALSPFFSSITLRGFDLTQLSNDTDVTPIVAECRI